MQDPRLSPAQKAELEIEIETEVRRESSIVQAFIVQKLLQKPCLATYTNVSVVTGQDTVENRRDASHKTNCLGGDSHRTGLLSLFTF